MAYRDALPPGTELAGDYRIEQVLGAGGFGITYRAADLRLHADVAIKEYFPNEFAIREETERVSSRGAGREEDYRWGLESFLKEAQTLARFKHPNIVRVARVFEGNNTAYMVLDFERGRSLREWLHELDGPPTQTELDALVGPILDALEVIHGNRFLHRDIAPDNIYVRQDGTPVLLDFGSARQAIGAHSRVLSAVIKHGFSPVEQYSAQGKQGAWTDIYALGATLYRAVTGQVPTESTARLLHDDLVSAADASLGSFRAPFLAAIDAALRPRPDDRPQSIREWRKMLFTDADRERDRQPATASAERGESLERPQEAEERRVSERASVAREAPPGPHSAPEAKAPPRRRTWLRLTAVLALVFGNMLVVTLSQAFAASSAIAAIFAIGFLAYVAAKNLRYLRAGAERPPDETMASVNTRLMSIGFLSLALASIVYALYHTIEGQYEANVAAFIVVLLCFALFFGIVSWRLRREGGGAVRIAAGIFAGIAAPLCLLLLKKSLWNSMVAWPDTATTSQEFIVPLLAAVIGVTAVLTVIGLFIERRRRRARIAAEAEAA